MKAEIGSFTPSKSACLLLILAALVSFPLPAARAVVLGSNITDITYTDGDPNEPSSSKPAVFTVPVSYGLVEELRARPVNPDGTAMDIRVSKSQPTLTYPLRYLHTVFYAPHEQLIRVKNTYQGVQKCIDWETAAYPTCGWTHDGPERIEDSQGFCSNRESSQLAPSYFDKSWWRGEEELGRQSSVADSFSIGHCLRPGEVAFHGYEMGVYTKDYGISASFTLEPVSETLNLSPEVPVAVRELVYGGKTYRLRADLLGDLDPFTAALDLSNYILYIPAFPDTDEMVRNYQANMLLIPREQVTWDGGECDKVGVSFERFRAEAFGVRKSEAGDCLANQLFQLYNKDMELLIVNREAEATYLVSGMKAFKESMQFVSGMSKALQYKIKEINRSLVSLAITTPPELEIASLEVVERESRGGIALARARTFPSLSKAGRLEVRITNWGEFAANYIVAVTDCNASQISPAIPAQARYLQPSESATLHFDLETLQNLRASHKCTVQLKSPRGREYDYLDVWFDTMEHRTDFPRDLHLENELSSP